MDNETIYEVVEKALTLLPIVVACDLASRLKDINPYAAQMLRKLEEAFDEMAATPDLREVLASLSDSGVTTLKDMGFVLTDAGGNPTSTLASIFLRETTLHYLSQALQRDSYLSEVFASATSEAN